MKNIVTALMQFVILVVALIIVTFAIPKIAGNDDRYDKYIAENSKADRHCGKCLWRCQRR